MRNKQITQKQRKSRILEEKFLPQEMKETAQQRKSSRLRNQPRKDYKTFIPKSKILKKFLNYKKLSKI